MRGQDAPPPHDIMAEQCVLGGMLLSATAITDVVSTGLSPTAHYRPAHQLVHETILALYNRGDPVDAVMAAAELSTRGELERVGGAPYLHTLIQQVPAAANAGHYARIVAAHAERREWLAHASR